MSKRVLGRWWRAYEEIVHDPKVQLLPGDLFKAWINLLCLASVNGGFLPSIDSLAFSLRMPVGQVETILDALQQYQLIDNINGRLQPHNWEVRQYRSDNDTSTVRVRRHRQQRRNVSGNGDGTFHETKRQSF
jgi:hypothetical protein